MTQSQDSTTAFEIGDRVRIASPFSRRDGDVGTVIDRSMEVADDWLVSFADCSDIWIYSHSELERINDREVDEPVSGSTGADDAQPQTTATASAEAVAAPAEHDAPVSLEALIQEATRRGYIVGFNAMEDPFVAVLVHRVTDREFSGLGVTLTMALQSALTNAPEKG